MAGRGSCAGSQGNPVSRDRDGGTEWPEEQYFGAGVLRAVSSLVSIKWHAINPDYDKLAQNSTSTASRL